MDRVWRLCFIWKLVLNKPVQVYVWKGGLLSGYSYILMNATSSSKLEFRSMPQHELQFLLVNVIMQDETRDSSVLTLPRYAMVNKCNGKIQSCHHGPCAIYLPNPSETQHHQRRKEGRRKGKEGDEGKEVSPDYADILQWKRTKLYTCWRVRQQSQWMIRRQCWSHLLGAHHHATCNILLSYIAVILSTCLWGTVLLCSMSIWKGFVYGLFPSWSLILRRWHCKFNWLVLNNISWSSKLTRKIWSLCWSAMITGMSTSLESHVHNQLTWLVPWFHVGNAFNIWTRKMDIRLPSMFTTVLDMILANVPVPIVLEPTFTLDHITLYIHILCPTAEKVALLDFGTTGNHTGIQMYRQKSNWQSKDDLDMKQLPRPKRWTQTWWNLLEWSCVPKS